MARHKQGRRVEGAGTGRRADGLGVAGQLRILGVGHRARRGDGAQHVPGVGAEGPDFCSTGTPHGRIRIPGVERLHGMVDRAEPRHGSNSARQQVGVDLAGQLAGVAVQPEDRTAPSRAMMVNGPSGVDMVNNWAFMAVAFIGVVVIAGAADLGALRAAVWAAAAARQRCIVA